MKLSRTQLDQLLFLLIRLFAEYMFRPFMIRPPSGRRFFVKETVPFYTKPYVKLKSVF
jgi:hypothetical protein